MPVKPIEYLSADAIRGSARAMATPPSPTYQCILATLRERFPEMEVALLRQERRTGGGDCGLRAWIAPAGAVEAIAAPIVWGETEADAEALLARLLCVDTLDTHRPQA